MTALVFSDFCLNIEGIVEAQDDIKNMVLYLRMMMETRRATAHGKREKSVYGGGATARQY